MANVDQSGDQDVDQDVERNTDGITISGCFNIIIIQLGVREVGRIAPQLSLRAEGGGQINKDVGTTANQGGQNAIDHSESENNQSQFADGNGRSGIAGDENDEAGGQQGIKVRDSKVRKSKIGSASAQGQTDGEEPGGGPGENLESTGSERKRLQTSRHPHRAGRHEPAADRSRANRGDAKP